MFAKLRELWVAALAYFLPLYPEIFFVTRGKIFGPEDTWNIHENKYTNIHETICFLFWSSCPGSRWAAVVLKPSETLNHLCMSHWCQQWRNKTSSPSHCLLLLFYSVSWRHCEELVQWWKYVRIVFGLNKPTWKLKLKLNSNYRLFLWAKEIYL